jgi:hypothetical protein
MGANMARRLKECGYEIAAVHDVNIDAAQSLAQELGCPAVARLQEVTKASDIIITVVSDDKAMKNIYNGGLLSRARGKLFINCATITPDVHVWVEGKAAKAGAQSLEACMASSIPQARQGTLYPYEGCQEGRSDFGRFVWVRLTSCGAQRMRSGVTRGSGGTNDSPHRVAVAQRARPSCLFKALFPFSSRLRVSAEQCVKQVVDRCRRRDQCLTPRSRTDSYPDSWELTQRPSCRSCVTGSDRGVRPI